MKLLKKINRLNYLTLLINLITSAITIVYGLTHSFLLVCIGIGWALGSTSVFLLRKLLNDYNNKVVDVVNPLARYELDDEDEYDQE